MQSQPESEELANAESLFQVILKIIRPTSSRNVERAVQVAGLTTMLSAKGRVCRNKVYILDKMQTLRNRLQGYIDQGSQKVQKRTEQEAAAKSAWLDAEAEYMVQKKAAEDADAAVAQDMKKVEQLMSLLELNKARLAKVRAKVTEELSEIDEEEAIIRELLGYIGDLHSSTVDVVSSCFL
jgi:hypothetical protein